MVDEVTQARRERGQRRRNGRQQLTTAEAAVPRLTQLTLGIDQLQADAEQYVRDNPEIWAEFRRLAYLALERGVAHTSAKWLIDHMRWETAMAGGDGWKINDRYTSRMVRMLITEDQRFERLFETRRLRAG